MRAAPGAEREAHAHLALPPRSAREHQRGDVGAGEKQDQPEKDHQHRDGGGEDLLLREQAAAAVAQRQPRHGVAGVDRERRADDGGRTACRAPPAPRGRSRPVSCAPGCCRPRPRVRSQFRPLEAGVTSVAFASATITSGVCEGSVLAAPVKPLGIHADDRDRHIVEFDRLSERGRRPGKFPLPELVADHDHGFAARGVVGGTNRAAELRLTPRTA